MLTIDMMISGVARVNSSHPYLENDPSSSLVSHRLRISPWLRFRRCSATRKPWNGLHRLGRSSSRFQLRIATLGSFPAGAVAQDFANFIGSMGVVPAAFCL